MLCVMGVLKTQKGLIIKERISAYLNKYFESIFYVEQDPPGVLFEYPAILCTLKMAIDMNEPVLYIHTKGAADPYKMWYQKPVKKLWQQEFGTDKVIETYKKVCIDEPTVICPIAGIKKQTWWNAFIINPAAAKIILPTLKHPSVLKDKCVSPNSRYYYESFMCNLPNINVISSAVACPCSENLTNKLLLELTKNLPDIDY